MSRSNKFNKELLSESINAVLSMDQSDLVNNVVDILVSTDYESGYAEYKPRRVRRGLSWALINYVSNFSEMARRVADRLFPVPPTPKSFYADIW
ncbi:MAG TPA: hypothetical protein VKA08_13165 [Balneolales bacterium]|nr:hypothetical protein [Balneolales bacterium]